MTYEDMAERWLTLAQRNASHATDRCSDVIKGKGRVLWLLLKNEGVMLAGEIGDATGNTSGRVANLLRQLEEEGLIRRNQGQVDKRQTLVSLTELGRERAIQVKRDNIQRESQVLKKLGKEEAQELIRLFERYLDAKADQSRNQRT